MSQLLKVQLEDEDGNVYYLHTSGDSVFLDDGRTVQAAIEQTVRQSSISNVQINDSSKVPSAALAYAMQQQITENEEAITGLNNDHGLTIAYPTILYGETPNWNKVYIRKQFNICIINGTIRLPADSAYNKKELFAFPDGYKPNDLIAVMVRNHKSTVRVMREVGYNTLTVQYPETQSDTQEYWFNIAYTCSLVS